VEQSLTLNPELGMPTAPSASSTRGLPKKRRAGRPQQAKSEPPRKRVQSKLETVKPFSPFQ
jgi:hypothetical protein